MQKTWRELQSSEKGRDARDKEWEGEIYFIRKFCLQIHIPKSLHTISIICLFLPTAEGP